jgi:Tol biopolymer transport system component
VATTFTPDRKGLIVQEVSNDLLNGDVSVIILPLDRKSPPRPLIEGVAGPELSPDGQWLAYHANRTGRDEVYVQPYPGPGAAVQVSRAGGMMPIWRRDGKELFYWLPASADGGKRTVMGAAITSKPSFQAAEPKVVLEGPYYMSSPGRSYDVAPDGQRFVIVRNDERVNQPPLTDMLVVHGWIDELKQRMLVKRTTTQP